MYVTQGSYDRRFRKCLKDLKLWWTITLSITACVNKGLASARADDVQEFTTLDPVTISNACDVRVNAHRLEI